MWRGATVDAGARPVLYARLPCSLRSPALFFTRGRLLRAQLKHFGEELEELRRSFREDAYAQVRGVWCGVHSAGPLKGRLVGCLAP